MCRYGIIGISSNLRCVESALERDLSFGELGRRLRCMMRGAIFEGGWEQVLWVCNQEVLAQAEYLRCTANRNRVGKCHVVTNRITPALLGEFIEACQSTTALVVLAQASADALRVELGGVTQPHYGSFSLQVFDPREPQRIIMS